MKNERSELSTIALFEVDGMITDFTATVISCKTYTVDGKNLYALELDRTAFFPEGGGQQSDVGTIDGIDVIDVTRDENGNILHIVEKAFDEEKSVRGAVDPVVRMSRMQNHGAEHLLSGLIHEKYGYDNVGFHMSDGEVRFDINGFLNRDQLAEIERRANEIIYEDVPIIISFPDPEAAQKLEYRSKLDTYDNIRLVTIDGYDVCACCAPHLESTGQFGIVKIIDSMPHRQGTRITMVAGIEAYEDYKRLHELNEKIMALLSSKRELTAQYVSELSERNDKLKEENTALKREMSKILTETVLENIRSRSDKVVHVIFTEILDNVGLRNLINTCMEEYKGVVAGFIGNDSDGYRYICASTGEYDLKQMIDKLNKRFNGKGGGSPKMVQGSLAGTRAEIEKYFDEMF